MFMSNGKSLVVGLGALAVVITGFEAGAETTEQFPELGRTAEPGEIKAWDTDIPFDGEGLPTGEGTYESGKALYQEQCASCHGANMEGVAELGRGPLIGPGRTVNAHWPYAPTLFDYVRRAMPFNAPNSLSDEDVYALCAYILGEGGIHPKDRPMNAETLAATKMPNQKNFIPDPRPDVK